MIYPRRCPICNDIVTKGRLVCGKCRGKLQYVEEPFCIKCGKPIVEESKEYCHDCESKTHAYDEGRAALVYDEYMSKSIYRFKYNKKQEYSVFYGKVICDRLSRKIMSWNADALIPVPVHKDKLKNRGFNQATLIAKAISFHTNIPVLENIVIRKKSTEVQKNLSAKERENNLKNAFNITQNSVKLNNVIIVDDIYTTGSTVDAVAMCLRQAGVKKVYYISLCIGRGY